MAIPDLPDPSALTAIETEFWTPDGVVPDDAELVVRGAPITSEKFLAHAIRQSREYSLRGVNMFSVSCDIVMPMWTLERILSGQLATYSRFATADISGLRSVGFELLATGVPPHVDVVFPAPDTLWAKRLVELLRPTEQRNPYKSRR